jgi:hypothetical protein
MDPFTLGFFASIGIEKGKPSMDGPSTVAVCVDTACDDSRFTA